MKKIYSKIKEDLLLHIIIKKEDFLDGRQDVIDADNPLQLSLLKLNEGKTFKPHKHIFNNKETKITQESWVVISGRVKAILYDIDDTIIEEVILNPGESSITLRGGHNYLILENNTFVYEYKTGPYKGQEYDKEFIND